MTAYRLKRGAPVWLRIVTQVVRDDNDCWNWQGYQARGGYGRITATPYGTSAHRVAYQAFVGPIPAGFQLDHLCRNPPCVNPSHLEPVTNAVNRRRRSGHQTHCKNGHEFTPENTYIQSNGGRTCRECSQTSRIEYRQRQRLGGGKRFLERLVDAEAQRDQALSLVEAMRQYVSDEQYVQAVRMSSPLDLDVAS